MSPTADTRGTPLAGTFAVGPEGWGRSSGRKQTEASLHLVDRRLHLMSSRWHYRRWSTVGTHA